MKPRVLITIVLATCLSLALTFAQSKDNCSSKSASEKSSCCMKGAKASMSSNMKSAAIIQTNYTADDANAAHCSKDSKECIAKGAKQASECTDAEKAHCNMTKASLTKAGTKSCCKAKGVEAKADAKKGAQEKSTDGKGTN